MADHGWTKAQTDLLKAGATEQLAKKRAQRHGYRIDYDKLVTPDHDEESVKNEFSRLYDAGELPKDIATGYERTKEYEEKMTGNPNVSRAQARATKRAEQKAARRVAHANAAAGGSGSGQATAASNASGSQAGGGFGGGSTAPFGGGSAARNAGSAAPFGAAANALVPGGNGGAALFNGGPDDTANDANGNAADDALHPFEAQMKECIAAADENFGDYDPFGSGGDGQKYAFDYNMDDATDLGAMVNAGMSSSEAVSTASQMAGGAQNAHNSFGMTGGFGAGTSTAAGGQSASGFTTTDNAQSAYSNFNKAGNFGAGTSTAAGGQNASNFTMTGAAGEFGNMGRPDQSALAASRAQNYDADEAAIERDLNQAVNAASNARKGKGKDKGTGYDDSHFQMADKSNFDFDSYYKDSDAATAGSAVGPATGSAAGLADVPGTGPTTGPASGDAAVGSCPITDLIGNYIAEHGGLVQAGHQTNVPAEGAAHNNNIGDGEQVGLSGSGDALAEASGAANAGQVVQNNNNREVPPSARPMSTDTFLLPIIHRPATNEPPISPWEINQYILDEDVALNTPVETDFFRAEYENIMRARHGPAYNIDDYDAYGNPINPSVPRLPSYSNFLDEHDPFGADQDEEDGQA